MENKTKEKTKITQPALNKDEVKKAALRLQYKFKRLH